MIDFNPPICRRLMMLDENGRYFCGQFNGYGEGRYNNISTGSHEIRQIVAWGELPAEDDPRWVPYRDGSKPGKGQWVLRLNYNWGRDYSPYFDRHLSNEPYPFPGFMGCPEHHDTDAKAWMPVEQLELPHRMPEEIRRMRPRAEINREARARELAYHTDAMVVGVINDGPTYRGLFWPLCSRGRTAFFTAKGEPRKMVLREIHQKIVRIYSGEEGHVPYAAYRAATKAVFDYYVQHSDELRQTAGAC